MAAGSSPSQDADSARARDGENRDGEGAHLHCVADLIARARESVEDGKTSLGTLVDNLGRLSHSALLLVPALVVATPLSGVPGVSGTGGIIIALVAAQALIGRRKLWFPQWLRRKKIDSDKLDNALAKLEKPAAWIDRQTQRRASFIFRGPGLGMLHVVCMLCGAAMPLLELVPMTSSILAVAVVFFAVAIVARDGLLALVGFGFILGTIATAVAVLTG